MCAYYKRFVLDCTMYAPLTVLTKYTEQFHRTEEQQRAFDELKKRLQTLPILGHFNQHVETEVHADTNSAGLRTVLVQTQEGLERVITYATRILFKAESNYPTTEKECLAVVWTIT